MANVAGGPAPAGSDREALLAELGRLDTPAAERKTLEAWNRQVASEGARALPHVSLIQEAKRLLASTSIDGRCPLCGQAVDEKELARRIEGSLLSMMEATRELEKSRDALGQLAGTLRAAHERREALVKRARPQQVELPALPAFPGLALAGIDAHAAVDAPAVLDYHAALKKWDAAARDTAV